MRLEDLTGRRVALLGLGIDVRAALGQVLAAEPSEVVVVDAAAERGELDVPDGVRVATLEDAAAGAEVLVRSPGFPRYQQPLLDALDRGARMTTPVDLWIGSRPAGQRVVAVTGTKGKSTVAHLVHHLAENVGLRVGMAGNMGVPIFSDDWDHDAPVVVVEVSSYQAADLHSPPDVAVLTSLTEDHLDWHRGRDRYVSDKLRVLANDGGDAGCVLVAAGDAGAMRAAEPYSARPVDAPPAPADVPVHRLQNAALAAAVIAELGGPTIDDETIVTAARRSLPGRLDRCEGPAGATWVDDALASNPTAAAAGLAWARDTDRSTIVLLGGADRGVDVGPLAAEVRRWAPGRLAAIVLPDNGARLAENCGIAVLEHAADVADAVRLAAAHLAASSLDASPLAASSRSEPAGDSGPPGDEALVLFSPAAPTPAGSGDWTTRSASFRAALAELT